MFVVYTNSIYTVCVFVIEILTSKNAERLTTHLTLFLTKGTYIHTVLLLWNLRIRDMLLTSVFFFFRGRNVRTIYRQGGKHSLHSSECPLSRVPLYLIFSFSKTVAAVRSTIFSRSRNLARTAECRFHGNQRCGRGLVRVMVGRRREEGEG